MYYTVMPRRPCKYYCIPCVRYRRKSWPVVVVREDYLRHAHTHIHSLTAMHTVSGGVGGGAVCAGVTKLIETDYYLTKL